LLKFFATVSAVFALAGALSGCNHMAPSHDAIRVASPAEYADLVGKRVELVGTVTQSRVPQIGGVDVPELENHRGRNVKVTGVLRRSDVTQSQIAAEEQRLGGKFAHRGAGTFYSLDEVQYQLQP
jgi:hypothetical protein